MKTTQWETEIRPKVFTVAIDEPNQIWVSVLGPLGAGHARIAARTKKLLYPNRVFPILRDIDHLDQSLPATSIATNLNQSIEYARRWGYSVIVSAPAMTANEQHNMLNEALRNQYRTHCVLIAISAETNQQNAAIHQQHGPLGAQRTGWNMNSYIATAGRIATDPAINRITILTPGGDLLYDSPTWQDDRPIKVNRILTREARRKPSPTETAELALHQQLLTGKTATPARYTQTALEPPTIGIET